MALRVACTGLEIKESKQNKKTLAEPHPHGFSAVQDIMHGTESAVPNGYHLHNVDKRFVTAAIR